MAALWEKTEAITVAKLAKANGAVAVTVDDGTITTAVAVDGEFIDERGVEAGGRRGEPGGGCSGVEGVRRTAAMVFAVFEGNQIACDDEKG